MSVNTWIQISAGQGPAECEYAVALTLKAFLADMAKLDCQCDIVEEYKTSTGYKSVLLSTPLLSSDSRLQRWQGSIQWQFKSPFRPQHKRKNWFVDLFCQPEQKLSFVLDDIRIDTLRSQGAGGQHVNKTESAVRVTHLATNISVTCQQERSQHANKRMALRLLNFYLQQKNRDLKQTKTTERWLKHTQLERGNPIKRFIV